MGADEITSNMRTESGVYGKYSGGDSTKHQGRFPANLIFDEEGAKMLDEQTGNVGCSSNREKYKGRNYGTSVFLGEKPLFNSPTYTDKGGASRFFYCAKASKAERNMGCEEIGGCKHPTVKPLALMEYLVNLVSREGATVLDPFMGSGTTGIACKKLGRNFIGIEREEEYIKIAEARIKATPEPLPTLF